MSGDQVLTSSDGPDVGGKYLLIRLQLTFLLELVPFDHVML